MAKGRSKAEFDRELARSFDKNLVHAVIARAISQLEDAGIEIEDRQLLYRMGLVGVMATCIALDETVPKVVHSSIKSGRPLSTKRWQEILKGG